ncbi:calcium-translocating P-type ATPase, PMCA-type [Anaerophilus nitritogenes]|uniref:calcium-translocating P-type ATPase, PMCA-type n=1 Tax=Anaerophilus nitritogenes TaxID=2498136 RepID=UPI00101DE29B|nr:calcium-translocating P-type ATPase, PMCA-type [Anaerophilus nitritogenes]
MKFYNGLTSEEVEISRQKYGTNQLTPSQGETFWDKLKGNLNDPIIKILIVALFINVIFFFFGKSEWYESLGIALAVVLATLISTVSEYSNENSFQKLQEEASKIRIKVFRDGIAQELLIDELVKGDYILLQPGDKVPVDGFLLDGNIKVDQSTLNGESEEVSKIASSSEVDFSKDDFSDPKKVYRGSVVTSGEAILIASRIGDTTTFGKIAQELSMGDDIDSPLKIKLKDLADKIALFGYIGGTLIAISYFFKTAVIDNQFNTQTILQYLSNWTNQYPALGNPLNDLVTAFILAIIIIVVAVPEGLPMMIAIVLSLNMRKLLSDNLLVRKLIGIETAGSINILFSDKTGTITKGHLECVEFITGNGESFKSFGQLSIPFKKLMKTSIQYNTAAVISDTHTNHPQVVGGNATDRALMNFVDFSFDSTNTFNKIGEIEFSSNRKFSASQLSGDFNGVLMKGAPEKLLDKCTHYYDVEGNKQNFSKELYTNLDKQMEILANRSMRLLAFVTSNGEISNDQVTGDHTLVGIVGIRDEIRLESIKAIKEAQNAGIQVVMITGDRKETAVAIAKETGLLKNDQDLAFTSEEINNMTDDELKKVLTHIRVISRALPSDKSRLVKISQELGLVVGMTGDGVNDSPALKRADVGFAMGSGTEVAKEAGDIVVLDDNFLSITKSILYGRTIFNSIRKFIIFQLTINVAAVLVAFMGPFLGLAGGLPLTMTQMLWVNLVMDTLAALAFGGEPALLRYMLEKPKTRTEGIVSKSMWNSILFNGIFVAIASILFLSSDMIHKAFRSSQGDIVFLTGFFSFFIFLNVFNMFNARTEKANIFDNIRKNPGFSKVVLFIIFVQIMLTFVGGKILRTAPLNMHEWMIIIGLSFFIIPLNMIRKKLFTKKETSYAREEVKTNI